MEQWQPAIAAGPHVILRDLRGFPLLPTSACGACIIAGGGLIVALALLKVGHSNVTQLVERMAVIHQLADEKSTWDRADIGMPAILCRGDTDNGRN